MASRAGLAVVLVLGLAVAASSWGGASAGPVSTARVERVVDGDTIVLVGGARVRLLQIDTPEPGTAECYSRAAGRERLRGKLSYSNAGFALAPPTFTLAELREVYVAALGHDVSATNLRRVLERRAVIEQTGERRPSGRAGGRPAEVFRFRDAQLAITDPFAALRPRKRHVRRGG